MKNRKKEIYCIIIVGIFLLGLVLFIEYGNRGHGTIVSITCDGELYGTYELNKDQVIELEIGNILEIKNGIANMIWADCPNQVCVETKPISEKGEMIVCLPHKLVIQIIGDEIEK